MARHVRIPHTVQDDVRYFRLAKHLGVSRREAVGLVVEFYAWAIVYYPSGIVTDLEPELIDDILHQLGAGAGFRAAGFIVPREDGAVEIDDWLSISGRLADRFDARREAGSLGRRLRFRVLSRDGFRCVYCGATADRVALHIDHVVPVVAGGKTVLSNLATACIDCNLGKAATTHLGGS